MHNPVGAELFAQRRAFTGRALQMLKKKTMGEIDA